MEDKRLDALFQQKLANHQVAPSAGARHILEAQLQARKKKRKGAFWWSVAASFLVLLVAGWWMSSSKTATVISTHEHIPADTSKALLTQPLLAEDTSYQTISEELAPKMLVKKENTKNLQVAGSNIQEKRKEIQTNTHTSETFPLAVQKEGLLTVPTPTLAVDTGSIQVKEILEKAMVKQESKEPVKGSVKIVYILPPVKNPNAMAAQQSDGKSSLGKIIAFAKELTESGGLGAIRDAKDELFKLNSQKKEKKETP
ncbi:hypothetical protein AAG747_16340 [Rapidithrix thailandica]|uniref:Anti-sigma factor n=1 Tax=Rapidithrix thailandica TaxID=413964 RepID=A0AAW9RX98_9BACT